MRGRSRPTVALLVALPIALLLACTSGSGRSAVRPSREVVPPPPLLAAGEPDSADRILIWVGCRQLVDMDDATLDMWHSRGIDGFICQTQSLYALGGGNQFTRDVTHIPDGDASFDMERGLASSRIGERAAARGMDLYLAFYLVNKQNTATPLIDWFDDDGWSTRVLPAVTDLAAAAHALGFKGMAVDQELYPQNGGVKTATWDWRYPGNKRDESTTRAKVRARGQALMEALADGMPGLDVMAYGTQFPGTWFAYVQQQANDIADAFASSVQLEFWDGMSSGTGYRLIRLLNEAFYKSPGTRNTSWDAALQQEYNLLFSELSQRFSNWAYAAPRFEESPFSWISSGNSDFEAARSPDEVADQLDAFSRWGMGSTFANYSFGRLDTFDYGPYLPALSSASTPRVVTSAAPTVRVTAPSTQPFFTATSPNVALEGSSKDPYAIWYITWQNDRGGSGTAKLTWVPGEGDDRNGYPNWEMRWTADIPLQPGQNVIQITAVGIKRLATNLVVTISR